MHCSAPRLFALTVILILASCSHVQKHRAAAPSEVAVAGAADATGDDSVQPIIQDDSTVAAAAADSTMDNWRPTVTSAQPQDSLSDAPWQLSASDNGTKLAASVRPPKTDEVGAGFLDLAELEELAIQNNPTLRQIAWSVDRASGIRRQVGLYPNPRVGYSASEVGNNGSAGQQGGYVSQTIVLGDKLRLNRDVLEQDIQSLSWAGEAQRLRVLNDLRLAYFEALGAQRRVELAEELEKVADHGVQSAKLLFEAKQGAKPDILLAEIQLNHVRIIHQNAQNDYDTAWRRLASFVAIPDMAHRPLSGDIQAAIPDYEVDNLYERIVSGSPELQVAYAKVQRAQANIRRQESQPVPNLLTQVGVAHDYTSGDDIANLQIGVALPVFNRNEGRISAAHAEYHRACQDVERLRLALRIRLNDTFRSFVQSRNQVVRIETDILPRANENRELTEEAYRLGQFDFLRVLTARRTYIESNLRYVEALTELRKAETLIDGLLLTGGLDAPPNFEGDAGLRGQALSGQ